MAIGTYTDYQSLYKTRYVDTGQAKKILRSKRPFYDMIPREHDQTGKFIHSPVSIAPGRGYAKGDNGLARLNAAASTVGPMKVVHFMQSLEREYGRVDFDNVVTLQMGDNKGAFYRAFDEEMKHLLNRFGRSISQALFRNGDGTISTVAAVSISGGSGTITLSEKLSALQIDIGDSLNIVNPASPANPRGGDFDTSYFTVTAKNDQAGILSVTRVGSNAVDSTAVGDLVCRKDEYSQNGVGRVRGLAAICPLVAPTTGDSFYSVDRSQNVNMLAGWRYDGSASDPLEEQIKQMAVYMSTSSSGEDIEAYANTLRVQEVLDRGYGKIALTEDTIENGEYTYGIRKCVIATADGNVTLYPTPECPMDRWFGLSKGAVTLGLLGEEPTIITTDGVSQHRIPGQDATTVEARVLAQVLIKRPCDIVTGPLV